VVTAKAWMLLGFLCTSFVAGGVGQYAYLGMEVSPVDMWLLPVFSFLLFFWYRIDAGQHGYRRSPWLNVCVIAVALIALPYYFFRSRGFKGGAAATVLMLAFFTLSGAVSMAGQYAAYYGLQR
jgi:hypothetical protein